MAGFEKASPEDKGKTRGKKVDYTDYDPVSYSRGIPFITLTRHMY